jgi:hypothetical protein
MKKILLLFLVVCCNIPTFSQSEKNTRSSLYLIYGNSGANVREFNEMLNQKGLSPLRQGYSSFGVGYMSRYNDFILGLELYQNNGHYSKFSNYRLDQRTTRALINVGYSFTEEGRFQLLHYMSMGIGFLNFQMLNDEKKALNQFLTSPASGFILREGNLHKGSRYLSGFLTEIGFQLTYDFELPGREEMLQIVGKFGYSFSPFEGSWQMQGISFKNLQSGPFIRLGAGITLPDYNFFYKDASLGAHLIYGMQFTSPDALNTSLVANDLTPFSGRPNNWGLKLLGESKGVLYGFDFYNLGYGNKANEQYEHTLNSIRIYGNGGIKLYEKRNFELGALGGLGFGNLRYTMIHLQKPNFPTLFEEPLYDGQLKTSGLMLKPEVYLAYGLPLPNLNLFNLILSVHGGYEAPVGRYRLGNASMVSYMSNPYLNFSVGFRP